MSKSEKEKLCPPFVSLSNSISLLKRQQEKGREIIDLRPIDDDHYRSWENTTREFVIKAFGSNSSNVKAITSIGKYASFPINGSKEWWENHRAESLKKQLVMLDSLIEQLEAEIIFSPKEESFNALSIIETVCYKFHSVAKQLKNRHDNRQTLDIADEYDVQDLFHSLLKIFFDDIRDEECTPSYAGRASRMDFLLKDYLIVIEVKKTRIGLGTKEIGSQLIEDIARYKEHPDCNTLVCFVYDPEGRITNPRGLENDLSQQVNSFLVKVIIVPKN